MHHIISGCIGIIYLHDSSAIVHSERSVAVRYGRRERAHNSDATGNDIARLYKPNQLICGTGQTAIVSGWTVKSAILSPGLR